MSIKSRILYISYNGLLEEIVSSQVIPYLRELAGRGYFFTLLTFEKKEKLRAVNKGELAELKKQLKDIGIDWHWLRYHKRIPLLATSLDVLIGSVYALCLFVRGEIRIVHARSVVPAAMSLLSRLCGARFVFDTRGLLADEYIGGGHWKEESLHYKITKFFERMCLKAADAIVVLTEKHCEYLSGLPFMGNRKKKDLIKVIPCCVDTDRFKKVFSGSGPLEERLRGKFVLTYLGKVGKHYMLDEMLDFFKSAEKMLPDVVFMILTQSDRNAVFWAIEQKKINSDRIIVEKAPGKDVPCLLSLSSAGIFFINPYKKFGSSPIKLGEFLSCSIPVIINKGIGDTEELVDSNRVGVAVGEFNEDAYRKSLAEFLKLIEERELPERCRRTAEKYLSLGMGVDRYDLIYRGLA